MGMKKPALTRGLCIDPVDQRRGLNWLSVQAVTRTFPSTVTLPAGIERVEPSAVRMRKLVARPGLRQAGPPW